MKISFLFDTANTLSHFASIFRKVNKSYRGRSCPMIIHCSDGVGRSGTYVLIDMVLNRMMKGSKEIDIAATLEHIRDQRAGKKDLWDENKSFEWMNQTNHVSIWYFSRNGSDEISVWVLSNGCSWGDPRHFKSLAAVREELRTRWKPWDNRHGLTDGRTTIKRLHTWLLSNKTNGHTCLKRSNSKLQTC